ncbi:hypothetical protein SAMN02745866_01659 [Alteromonadaceae bacterium Bs31]|nr:hypothetical protein SAMN02745866_01659 [Alteromonadaceae bacterium Bs31]
MSQCFSSDDGINFRCFSCVKHLGFVAAPYGKVCSISKGPSQIAVIVLAIIVPLNLAVTESTAGARLPYVYQASHLTFHF